MGLGLWAQSAADVRPPRAPASAPDTAAAGKDPWIRRAVTGELPEPHAPSALLELSSLDPGLGARAQGEWRAASIARGSRRTRTGKRSGWDSASVGHLVCLVQSCVKGLYLYLYLYPPSPPSSTCVPEARPPRTGGRPTCCPCSRRCRSPRSSLFVMFVRSITRASPPPKRYAPNRAELDRQLPER